MTDTPAPAADKADTATDAAKSMEHMIPKARLDEEIGKRRVLETEYAQLADAVLSEVPEHLKALIPAELSPAARLKWFRTAKQTGIFDAKPKVPETDKGKPTTTPMDRDLSTLPAYARIAAGYGK